MTASAIAEAIEAVFRWLIKSAKEAYAQTTSNLYLTPDTKSTPLIIMEAFSFTASDRNQYTFGMPLLASCIINAVGSWIESEISRQFVAAKMCLSEHDSCNNLPVAREQSDSNTSVVNILSKPLRVRVDGSKFDPLSPDAGLYYLWSRD